MELGGLGIRNTKLTNDVALAKLSWKISQGDSSLWAQTLKAKYVDPCKTKMERKLALKGGPSSINKRALVRDVDLFNSNVLWVMKNGLKIRFWWDNWTGLGPIRSLVARPFARDEEGFLISECFGPNRT
ncbi:hypothetical protein ACH5RR_021105 [Cinchona calisaya]|uniref:Uncharacterized protein n=1 Tax=Cinchona calisaya TaxID=153742 RepID=A0ABD2ZI50_9GENT